MMYETERQRILHRHHWWGAWVNIAACCGGNFGLLRDQIGMMDRDIASAYIYFLPPLTAASSGSDTPARLLMPAFPILVVYCNLGHLILMSVPTPSHHVTVEVSAPLEDDFFSVLISAHEIAIRDHVKLIGRSRSCDINLTSY